MQQGDSLNLVCRDGSGDCVLYSQTWKIIVRGLKADDVFTEYNRLFPKMVEGQGRTEVGVIEQAGERMWTES